jgi:hypothetical protein
MKHIKLITHIGVGIVVSCLSLQANRASAQTILNFDSVDASAGQVDATSYFASYGITETALIAGSAIDIYSDVNYGGDDAAIASSAPNFVETTGGNSNSVLLTFSTPLTSLSFTRIEETGTGAGNSFGAWSAEVFSGATEIGSASASGYSIFNNNINPAQTYTFTGADITSIEFDGNDYIGNTPFYGSQGILMDDLTLTPVPEPSSLALSCLGLLGAFAWRRRSRSC